MSDWLQFEATASNEGSYERTSQNIICHSIEIEEPFLRGQKVWVEYKGFDEEGNEVCSGEVWWNHSKGDTYTAYAVQSDPERKSRSLPYIVLVTTPA